MTDALVIGGGVAGISAAARLAESGLAVTVLEAEDALAYHASSRAAGVFIADYGNDTVRTLNRASEAWLQENGILRPRGMMLVGKADDEAAFALDAASFGLEEIAPAEARARVPILSDAVAMAAGREDVHELDTDRTLQTFRKAALAAGARIVLKARVTAISPGWRVESTAGSFEADVLVNAAGAWADQVAAMAGAQPVGLTACRRSMARLPAPGGHDTRDWPLLDGPGERWYAKPDAGGLIVSPADADPVEPCDAWADDMVIAEGLARWEEMVDVPVTRVLSTWAGLRTFAPDKALVIGEAPGAAGFFWCAGQGGYGFQTAPAAADHLAALVTGRFSALTGSVAAALSPARFS